MKIKKLVAASLVAAAFFASPTTAAEDMLTGDARLACEAILCLSTGERPSECAPSIQRYFSISLRKFKDTLKARKKFLSLCPKAPQDDIDRTVAANPPDADLPEPVEPPAPVGPKTRQEIEAAIAYLTPIWEAQVKLSSAARVVVEACVQQKGRVQDGYCKAEMADFISKADPAKATRDEIYRLQDLLALLPVSAAS